MSPEDYDAVMERIGWTGFTLTKRLPCGTDQPRRWREGTAPVPDDVAEWLLAVAEAVEAVPSPRAGRKRRPRLTPSFDAYGLSYREVRVITCLVEGLSSPEIGLRLDISAATAAQDIRTVMHKTETLNRTQLALWVSRVLDAEKQRIAAQQAA